MSSDEIEVIARAFLEDMQACVRTVDFERAHTLFAEDVVSFGTYATVVNGRDRLEHEQWRNVWPNIRNFTFRLEALRCLGGTSGICLVVPWDSLGRDADGNTFERPGRATLLLVERESHWVAVHSHFSLSPPRSD